MKNFFILVFFCSCTIKASAQFDEGSEQKFGIKAGVNYSMMNFNAGYLSAASHVQKRWKPGFYLGALFQIHLNQLFSLQPEYLYTFMPGEDVQDKAKYTLDYLSLPLLLRVALGQRFALIGGPEFSLLIHSKKNLNGLSTSVTNDTEERSIMAVGGLEANITGSFYADARYLHGMNYVGLGQRSNVKEFKWRGVELGMGWRW